LGKAARRAGAVAELFFDEHADEALTKLERESSRPRLRAAVNRALDQLEADPRDKSVRRHRFTNGLWCVTFSDDEEDWVLLWESHPTEPDGIVVQYLGPASFA
jgi:hypothetical protein